MASLFDQVRQAAGNAVDIGSSIFGLPETGLSEKIAGGKTVNSGRAYAQTASTQQTSSLPNLGSLNLSGGAPFVPIAQLNQPQQSSNGGSSGGGGYQPGQNGYVNPGSIPGTDQYMKEIEDAYGGSSRYLDQAESALRSDYPTILSEIDAQKAAAERTATSGKESTLGSIQTQQGLAEQRNQNVLADSRRLYDELRRGYGQRFGGASSAGQAATELGNLEQQRQTGRVQQEFGNTLKQIESARVEVEKKFQDQLYQLEQTTNQAKNEANRDFQNKLLRIQQSRAENEQIKGQARLAALQDLRNKVYQINLQNMQFQQTLAAQKQSATSSLADYVTQLGGFGAQAESAANSFDPLVSSSLQTSNNSYAAANPYIGSRTLRDDELMGPTTPNRRQDFTA